MKFEDVSRKEFIKIAFDYTPGPLVDCKGPNGEPGKKASYADCKCYTYTPGDESSIKEAHRKAYMQDYHKQRAKRLGAVKTSVPFFSPTNSPVDENTEVPQTAADDAATTSDGPTFTDYQSGLSAAASKISHKEQNMYEADDLVRLARQVTADVSWFNGKSDSIYNRLEQLQSVIDELRTASSDPNLDHNSLSKISSIVTELDTEKESLQRVASEYIDFDTEEYLNSLPGGTVASTYRPTNFGTMDLGEDDGSLLYRTAKTIEDEFASADWVNLVTAGAEVWVEDQNNSLLNSQSSTREAASYYIEQKTLPILDVTKRAAVIDNFIENVEIVRRDKVASREYYTPKTASAKVASVDDILGTDANWF